MPTVLVKDSNNIDVALRRFKRVVEKSNIPTRLREKSNYIKPTEERKRKKAAAIKRHWKKKQKEREAAERDRGLL